MYDGVVRVYYYFDVFFICIIFSHREELFELIFFTSVQKKCFTASIEESLNLTLGVFMVLFPIYPG